MKCNSDGTPVRTKLELQISKKCMKILTAWLPQTSFAFFPRMISSGPQESEKKIWQLLGFSLAANKGNDQPKNILKHKWESDDS